MRYKKYRIVYDIYDGDVIIRVCLIGKRKEVYEQLTRVKR